MARRRRHRASKYGRRHHASGLDARNVGGGGIGRWVEAKWPQRSSRPCVGSVVCVGPTLTFLPAKHPGNVSGTITDDEFVDVVRRYVGSWTWRWTNGMSRLCLWPADSIGLSMGAMVRYARSLPSSVLGP